MEAVGRLLMIQVDCGDPVALAGFWSQVLGVEVDEALGDPPRYVNLGACPTAPDGPRIAFQRVPEPKTVKNRLHFDVEVNEVESATARVEALGGSRASTEDFCELGYRWRVMADPDGNEFCLIYSVPE